MESAVEDGIMWERARPVYNKARLAQSVERLALNQVVVGSSPTVGASFSPPRNIPIFLLDLINKSKTMLAGSFNRGRVDQI